MWIKAQAGRLFDAREFILTSGGGGGGSNKTEIRSSGKLCGAYKDAETAKAVFDMIEDFIAGGYETLFVMPGKDFMKQFEPLIDCQREADLVAEQAFKCCGGGFKAYIAAGIDVEKATESILKSCRSVGPVVTTIPIPDSVMHFDFLSHHGKNVVGVSFDKSTNIVSVEFDDPKAPVEKCCNCGAAGIYCIGCKQGLTNWTPKGGK